MQIVLLQLSETFRLLCKYCRFLTHSPARSSACYTHFISASFTPSHFPAVHENIYVSDMSPCGCAYLDVAHLVLQSQGVFLTFLAHAHSVCLLRKPTGKRFPPESQRVGQSYGDTLRSFSSFLSKCILPFQFTPV